MLNTNIVWPKGALVYDNRIGVEFKAGKAGKLHPIIKGFKYLLDELEDTEKRSARA
jgi:hypothetical protein